MEEEKEEETTRNIIHNRKWNWMIMKQAWKLFKAEGTFKNCQFHETLGINNNMYYKISGMQYNIRESSYEKVAETSGIPLKIIDGREWLKVNGFTIEDMERYIDECYQPLNDKRKEKRKEFFAKVKKELIYETMHARSKQPIYSVLYYFKMGKKYTDASVIEVKVTNITNKLQGLGWDELEKIDENMRNCYCKALQHQIELIQGIEIYNKEHQKKTM